MICCGSRRGVADAKSRSVQPILANRSRRCRPPRRHVRAAQDDGPLRREGHRVAACTVDRLRRDKVCPRSSAAGGTAPRSPTRIPVNPGMFRPRRQCCPARVIADHRGRGRNYPPSLRVRVAPSPRGSTTDAARITSHQVTTSGAPLRTFAVRSSRSIESAHVGRCSTNSRSATK